MEQNNTPLGLDARAQLHTEIVLLPAEQVLREFLLEAAQAFPGLEIWITGGWVRDHLLGIPSSDLDFALNNLTGKQFAKFLESFSVQPAVKSKYSKRARELGIPDYNGAKFSIIEKNAVMAKQLETAHGKLFGLDIDLVNLRKEVYQSNSRTPEMEFGTAEEDACRRDATVNALFYHLERQQVVDLTGKGIADLKAKIMRTPLDPYQTFMDDPLRILRLIRIGSKLGFEIATEAQSCMKDESIQVALDTIITRNRVNMELFKMTKDVHPEIALEKIHDCNLFTPVFLRFNSDLLESLEHTFPVQSGSAWPANWLNASRLLTNLLNSNTDLGLMAQSEENIDALWTMAIYTPLAELRHDRLESAVQEATGAVKLTAKTTSLLYAALSNFDSIKDLVDTVKSSSGDQFERSHVGMKIRSWGATWRTQVIYVLLSQSIHTRGDPSSRERSDLSSSRHTSGSQALLDKYNTFADYVWSKDLQDAHLKRPLLDGNQIQNLYGLSQNGTFMKNVLEGLLAWQFDHINGTVEEAKLWLLDQREALGVPLH